MHYENKTKAYARVKGGNIYPNIRGVVFFDEAEGGTEVSVEVWGLPPYTLAEGEGQPIGPLGFHYGSVSSLEKLMDENTIVTNHVVNDRDG